MISLPAVTTWSMPRAILRWVCAGLCLYAAASAVASTSLYPVKLQDPRAVYLTREAFPVHADGVGDDTAALQAAIDHVQSTQRQGILFIPEGRYLVSDTLHVWAGIRLIGYGAHRPVLVLAPGTPGFSGTSHRFMVEFCSERPVDPAAHAPNGTASTFYSAMSNIDMEIGEGNPSAVGVRFHVAQHSYLSHLRIQAGSAFAAIEDAGNLMTNLELIGGDYGIYTGLTAPTWPFVLMDSHLSGQRVAAIRSSSARPTLVRLQIDHVPTALLVEPPHVDQIVIIQSTLSEITGTAIFLGDVTNRRTGLIANQLRCRHVATLLSLPLQPPLLAPGKLYVVTSLRFGLRLTASGEDQDDTGSLTLESHMHAVSVLPPVPATDIPPLPPPATWVSIRSFGAAGDGNTDDTDAFRGALASHRPLYVPTGRYRITAPLQLPRNAVLIGLHPSATLLDLPDNTPAFAPPGNPLALLSTSPGDAAIVSGIGVSTGGVNNRATALLWRSGPHSLLDDVRFLGGHGTLLPNHRSRPAYNAERTADPDPNSVWGSEQPSLIVRGGGGTLRNLWTPSTYASAGIAIQNTSVPGHVYLLSAEHHLRNEIILDHVHHWNFYGLQTEEEEVEGSHALPLLIRNSSNLNFFNLAIYRVSRSRIPAPRAIEIDHAQALGFYNVHSYSGSRFAFDSTITGGTPDSFTIRSRIFNTWVLQAEPPPPLPSSPLIQKRLSGFTNLSSLSTASDGSLTFLDLPQPVIYRWNGVGSPQTLSTSTISPREIYMPNADAPPLLLTFGQRGTNALILGTPSHELPVQPFAIKPTLLPTAIRSDFLSLQNLIASSQVFPIEPDLQLPAESNAFLLRNSTGLARAVPGEPILITSEADQSTKSVTVQTTAPPHLAMTHFAPRGGDALIIDATIGITYLANGELYLYDRAGHQLGYIRTPERPVSLAISGTTLYFSSRTTLYSLALPISARDLVRP
ncbi:MAG: glycosyl hydrolase family 28-related protein [Acidobacteriaceae bacterium]|nr:glycosyl hydrolase family 28-related protein [Acidobacteriaceae bacterium]